MKQIKLTLTPRAAMMLFSAWSIYSSEITEMVSKNVDSSIREQLLSQLNDVDPLDIEYAKEKLGG